MMAEARKRGRFWSAAWWRGWLRRDWPSKLRSLEERSVTLESQTAQLEAAAQSIQSERAAAQSVFQKRLSRHIQAIIDERQSTIEVEEAELRAELQRITAQWHHAVSALGGFAVTPESLSERKREWENTHLEAQAQLAAARSWCNVVNEMLVDLPSALKARINVVAAQSSNFPSDAFFGDNAAPARCFDLLVIEEAERLTESEFMNLAKRARRWVLLADATIHAEHGSPPKNNGANAVRSAFFRRLWHNLHTDPSQLPYKWRIEDGKLRCTLRAISPHERKWLESETVLDRPDVELRIVSPPRGSPYLAEVVFPVATPAAEAKTYLYQELQEL
ncbi:MAG: hypothetical protein ACRD36_14225, partial [Candidatus Acidiferrum sp.]